MQKANIKIKATTEELESAKRAVAGRRMQPGRRQKDTLPLTKEAELIR